MFVRVVKIGIGVVAFCSRIVARPVSAVPFDGVGWNIVVTERGRGALVIGQDLFVDPVRIMFVIAVGGHGGIVDVGRRIYQ